MTLRSSCESISHGLKIVKNLGITSLDVTILKSVVIKPTLSRVTLGVKGLSIGIPRLTEASSVFVKAMRSGSDGSRGGKTDW